MARILIGVSGGIAAYKALEVVRLATKAGHAVRVVQTPGSQQFVGAASFAALTGAPVLTSEWERDPVRGAFPGDPMPSHDPASHLELVRNADVYVVAPATANTLAKLAGGHADNLLTSAALAARCPLVLAPAMNDAMWEHPATRANLALLRDRGAIVVDPGTGQLATKGEWGTGRLAEPPQILAAAEAAASAGPDARRTSGDPRAEGRPAGVTPPVASAPGPWSGLRVLVTAGGTREPIDAVRFVGNRSSGRMGFALASAAAARGATVTCAAANVALERDPAVTYVDVQTAAELEAACRDAFARTDVLLMAAAVADFRPVDVADHKLKKTDRSELVVRMAPTTDILSALAGLRRRGQTLVGFAAETGEGAIAYGRGKLERKGLDAVVVNDVAEKGIGFDASENAVTIATAAGDETVSRASKAQVAESVLDAVERLREGAPVA